MGDEDYLYAFRDVLVPVAEAYLPDIILVSAGFDTYYNDPLGGMAVTEAGFAAMSRILLDIAEKHCGGKALFVLEGGYDLKGLASSVKAVIMELKGQPIYPLRKKRGSINCDCSNDNNYKTFVNTVLGTFLIIFQLLLSIPFLLILYPL